MHPRSWLEFIAKFSSSRKDDEALEDAPYAHLLEESCIARSDHTLNPDASTGRAAWRRTLRLEIILEQAMGHQSYQIESERRVLIVKLYDSFIWNNSELAIGFADRRIHSLSMRRKYSDLSNDAARAERNTDSGQSD